MKNSMINFNLNDQFGRMCGESSPHPLLSAEQQARVHLVGTGG